MFQTAQLCRGLIVVAFLSLFHLAAVSAQPLDAESILQARCSGCHAETADGGLSRIANMRKTPEGWDMTLVRMSIWHGVEIPAPERATLVKYLADKQGLAPEESAPYRYILERDPNAFDVVDDEELQVNCARCHSFARVGLQRRDAEEWLKLSHTHIGQWPTIELQYGGRDRFLWEYMSKEVPTILGEMFPLRTPEWNAWKAAQKSNLEGEWRVVGHRLGRGGYQGIASVRRYGEDLYAATYKLTYADGKQLNGTGDVIVYTGYEWRGSARLGEENIQEVFAVAKDGNRFSGRWFLADADELGAYARAVRIREGHAEILAVFPPYLRAGEEGEITIHGTGLAGDVGFGDGVTVTATVSASPEMVTVRARAAADAASGAREVTVGNTTASDGFTVFRQVESVRIEPAFAIARVGGGAVAPVTAQFDAVAYLNGPDGEAGTDDDIRIGVMPATWSVDNFDEIAAAMEDAKFAGLMQPDGLFVPAIGGPNPARKYGTNNWGNLAVKAMISDNGRAIEGIGHLIVTVQRWNDPPIR